MKKNKYSFVIDMENAVSEGTAKFYIKHIVNNAKKLGLSITGQVNSRKAVARGLEFAGLGNAIIVGISKSADLEWVERLEYIAEKGMAPVLDIIEDYSEIIAKMREYAASRFVNYYTSNGDTVQVFVGEAFIMVGNKLIRKSEVSDILTLMSYV